MDGGSRPHGELDKPERLTGIPGKDFFARHREYSHVQRRLMNIMLDEFLRSRDGDDELKTPEARHENHEERPLINGFAAAQKSFSPLNG